MEIDSRLYQTFVEELRRAEDFRLKYEKLYPSAPLERDDPDVKRLIEAIALFSARTQISGKKQIQDFHLRVISQLFPYLIAPLPSMALVRVESSQLVETSKIEAGTPLIFSTSDDSTAIFTTLSETTVFPINRVETLFDENSAKSGTFSIKMESNVDKGQSLSTLCLYVNYLDDYRHSLAFWDFIRLNLKGIEASFDSADSITCTATFGSRNGKHNTVYSNRHPIFKHRIFFHFPDQELYINISIPKAPKKWRNCLISMTVSDLLPESMQCYPDIMQLFVIPTENIIYQKAEPITCDGTKSSYSIYPTQKNLNLSLHTVLGVYKNSKRGLVPLINSRFFQRTTLPRFEIDTTNSFDNNKPVKLHIDWPQAFDNSQVIIVEALWHQPQFSQFLWDKISVIPKHLDITGLKWSLVGKPVAYFDSKVRKNPENFFQLTALQNKLELTFDELIVLLDGINGTFNGWFSPIEEVFTDLSVEQSENGSKRTIVYNLQFVSEESTLMQSLINTFIKKVEQILIDWSNSTDIVVKQLQEIK